MESAVSRAVTLAGAKLTRVWGGTLFHPEDLPFSPGQMPVSYSLWRDQVCSCNVRPALSAPEHITGTPLQGWVSGSDVVSGGQENGCLAHDFRLDRHIRAAYREALCGSQPRHVYPQGQAFTVLYLSLRRLS